MTYRHFFTLVGILFFLNGCDNKQEAKQDPLDVKITVTEFDQGKNFAGHGSIKNNSDKAVKIVDVDFCCAEKSELHIHKHEDGVMKMKKVEAFEIPAGGTHEFVRGGDHLMAFAAKHPKSAGDTLMMTLSWIYADDANETPNQLAMRVPVIARQ